LDEAEAPFTGPGEAAERLPGYRLVRKISETPMSSVHLAEETGLGRQVVVKVLSRRITDDPGFRERFRREVLAAARTDHPNIVPLYASGEIDGRPYLVLRYVGGGDLGRLLRAGPGRLEPGRTVRVLAQVAAALDAAHEAGVVHRDVKPGNILIDTGSDHVYLSDFGIAKVESAETVTSTGQFLGTANYAAPEQIVGGQVDGRTDVYALGCVIHHCRPVPRPSAPTRPRRCCGATSTRPRRRSPRRVPNCIPVSTRSWRGRWPRNPETATPRAGSSPTRSRR
jgi:serine/threonine protein kinase